MARIKKEKEKIEEQLEKMFTDDHKKEMKPPLVKKFQKIKKSHNFLVQLRKLILVLFVLLAIIWVFLLAFFVFRG